MMWRYNLNMLRIFSFLQALIGFPFTSTFLFHYLELQYPHPDNKLEPAWGLVGSSGIDLCWVWNLAELSVLLNTK